MKTFPPLLLLLLLTAACGGDSENDGAPDPGAGASPDGAGDHGERKALGTVTVAGHRFAVDMLGEIAPGVEGAFEVRLDAAPEGTSLADVNVYLWVEDADDRPVSAPARGSIEGDHLHFHATPRADAGPLQRVVLRLRRDDIDDRAGLPLSGHGHEHGDAPHGGVTAAVLGQDGEAVAHLELKLHDDKGDLELWLGGDPKLRRPFDLPIDAEVTVTLVDLDNREVTLRARDQERNPDEDGNPNVRDGRTNYFVFPGGTGADSSFLKGAEFQSIAVVQFPVDGTVHRSEELVLVPHVH